MLPSIYPVTMILVACLDNVVRISSADLYPYGPSHGDIQAPINDDGSTAPVSIKSLFPFFNHQHDSLIVNTNGAISFLGTISTFTPSPFPLDSKRRLIAPYWTDVDTRIGGKIWYRESTEENLLQNATSQIRTVFPHQYRFQASWVFIATWDNVTFYGADTVGQQKRCTFQCLLITNGRHSFTMFLYDKIEWTTGTASQGNASTGLGGTPAQVGFDAGDGVNFYALNTSRTPDIINVTQTSNVNIPGKFIFGVDSADIKIGGCNINGTLTITPKEISMFGGTLLMISGPCFNQSEFVSLSMLNTDEVPCKFLSEQSISCVAPAVYRTGRERVSLTITPSQLKFSGVVTAVNHALENLLVTRSPIFWSHGSIVEIYWKEGEMRFPENADINIDLFYLEVGNNDVDIKLKHAFSLPPPNATEIEAGIYSFQLNFTKEAGIVRVSVNISNSPYYWSDMFTVSVNSSSSTEVCNKWYTHDKTINGIAVNDTIPCPCSLDVAFLDLTRFHKDPLCHGSAHHKNCLHQPFARLCFKENFPSPKGHDNQCCYDSDGDLMNPREYFGSGYVHRFHYAGSSPSNVPFLSNFLYDIVPYQHCCVYPIQDFTSADFNVFSSCELFYRRRPPNSCLNYMPPVVARVSGDPHFATFDGYLYTFNAIGEFLAIEKENFTLQLRLEQFGSSQGSSITSFAVQPYDTADIVEVQTNTIRGIDVLVNGEPVDFDSIISNSLSIKGSKIQRIVEDQLIVTVSFDKPKIAVKAFSVLNILNLLVMVSDDQRAGNFRGLLGNNDAIKDNDLISRNGTIIPSNASNTEIHNRFGLSWAIKESESLFKYTNGRSYSSYQNLNFNPAVVIPENIDQNITSVCGTNAECIYDYYVTGNVNLGHVSANSSQQYEQISNITTAVVSCGFPYTVDNGVWRADGYTEGSRALLECNPGYYPSDNLTTCLPSGNWSVINSLCITFASCGSPYTVDNGVWQAVGYTVWSRALLKCNPGYYPSDNITTCLPSGNWSVVNSSCIPFVSCGSLFIVDNGVWRVGGYTEGSTALLECNPGYYPSDNITTCLPSGNWSVIDSSCIPYARKTGPTTNSAIVGDANKPDDKTFIIIVPVVSVVVGIVIIISVIALVVRCRRQSTDNTDNPKCVDIS